MSLIKLKEINDFVLELRTNFLFLFVFVFVCILQTQTPQEKSRFPWWFSSKESACQCQRHGFNPWIGKLPLEKETATYFSILAWGIPWTEEPGGLQSMGLQKSQIRLSNSTKTQQFKNSSHKQ